MIADTQRFSIVSNEIPDPPYPADTKANGWKPEQDIQRIKQSRTWVLCPQSLRPWLLMVWMEAWESVPVGTYPADDDEMIAARIGMDQHEFEVRRKTLMRGWYRCSDGNLYHPYLGGMIAKMLGKRVASKERQRAFAERQKAKAEEAANALKSDPNALGVVSNTSLTDRKQEQEQETKDIPDKPARLAPKKFVPPSASEVAVYVREKGYAFDAERFVAYYESNGWKVGKNAMKDWRAACRTWHANSSEKSAPTATAAFAGDI